MIRKNYLFVYLAIVLSIYSCKKVDETAFKGVKDCVSSTSLDDKSYEISNEETATFASNFLSEQNKSSKTALSVREIVNFQLPVDRRKLKVVKFDPEGFVLMSNDTRHIPVYAFSDKGDFLFTDIEQLVPGQKEWILETFILNLELEKDSIAKVENGITKIWKSYLKQENSLKIIGDDDCVETFDHHVIDLYDECLLTTEWHQGLPYKLSTPICVQTGTRKPTGCVATAMGQVMNYWEHPSYVSWNILQDNYPVNSTTSSAYEVAGLMIDIGMAVNMNYGCDASSATSNAAKNAFKNDFGYSSSVTYDSYHIDDIKQNLRDGWPVLLGGYATRTYVAGFYFYSNGHQWITDGLREEYNLYEVDCLVGCCTHDISYIAKDYMYYLHMNWGWGSPTQNVWYYSNELTHPINSSYDFKWNKDMIIDIHP